MKLNESRNLKEIREELERRLTIMRYSNETIKAYMRIVGCVEEHLKEYGETVYTKNIGQRFSQSILYSKTTARCNAGMSKPLSGGWTTY